ncbi:LPXTG cell wall anchor domain-containing protein [Streptomyces barringtoniae]|uniref:LPXTG cell wall anchor domain-containing protein n=1 Tax=Streptomyces barringtoniae TaxID=2892029 RepID=UPI001E5491C1|nr:LPXTG cell wall anchor domain-containing protein [Streptomyces barringtoniae]MCC5477257.1 LPXTG cell wall anchor domain-containing protein [Streptomyces barringtoniae]
MASAMRAIEQAQDAVRTAQREARLMAPEASAPVAEPSESRSSGGGDYGDDEPSHKTSRDDESSYGKSGDYGDDDSGHGKSGSYGDDDSGHGKSGSYGDDDSGHGKSGSYGDDDSSYGKSDYGDDEHCGCYGEEENPPPHRHHPVTPIHKPHEHPKPPHRHVPPPHHHKHHHHHLAHTGSEGTIGAATAGAALLAAGTILYRRGRAAARK